MKAIVKGSIIIIILLAIALPFASDNPDGLEATMEKLDLRSIQFMRHHSTMEKPGDRA